MENLPVWVANLPTWVLIVLVVMWGINKWFFPFYESDFKITKKQFEDCKEQLQKNTQELEELRKVEHDLFGELENLKGWVEGKLGEEID